MWRASGTIDSSARLVCTGLLAIGLAVSACARGPLPAFGLRVHPAVLQHNISAWPDADEVCVDLPWAQALYLPRQCLSMRAIRGLILTTRAADDEGTR